MIITENTVKTLVLKLGVSPSNLGYSYIVEAIKICYEDRTLLRTITKKVYPHLAYTFNTTNTAVERAIRHSISGAVSHNPCIFDILGFPPSNNGGITNSQFLGACVEYLTMKEEEE